jgi:uncharacterized membrane protein
MLITATTLLATLPISVALSAQHSPGNPRHPEKLTQIDVPGASFTVALAINARDDILGVYGDSSGNFHGFLLSKGNFTTIVVPGAVQTEANGINPRGHIVGDYTDSNGDTHGFLLSK